MSEDRNKKIAELEDQVRRLQDQIRQLEYQKHKEKEDRQGVRILLVIVVIIYSAFTGNYSAAIMLLFVAAVMAKIHSDMRKRSAILRKKSGFTTG